MNLIAVVEPITQEFHRQELGSIEFLGSPSPKSRALRGAALDMATLVATLKRHEIAIEYSHNNITIEMPGILIYRSRYQDDVTVVEE